MISTIFLDLDGVLCDLHSPVFSALNVDVAKWPLGTYDIAAATGLPIDRIWGDDRFQGADFWATLPKLPWADDLVSLACRALGRENVVFLTQPVRDPGSLAGKARWIAEHYPRHGFLIGRPKHVCARADRLLVDDAPHNVEEFQKHAGDAILVPRIWNDLHRLAGDPFAHVLAEFSARGLA